MSTCVFEANSARTNVAESWEIWHVGANVHIELTWLDPAYLAPARSVKSRNSLLDWQWRTEQNCTATSERRRCAFRSK